MQTIEHGLRGSASREHRGVGRKLTCTWNHFFDIPMVKDVWDQRRRIGFSRVRSWKFPVIHEIESEFYSGAKLTVAGQNLPEIHIRNIGGVNSPHQKPVGFLPYNLMGDLSPRIQQVDGGNAKLTAHMQYIDRARADEFLISEQFGYHSWENETRVSVLMDKPAALQILGITEGQYANIRYWFKHNKEAVQWAWRWWLYDEGGNIHVGGKGRLDVRCAFDCPLKTWRCDLDLSYDRSSDTVLLQLDWLNMAGDILWARWLHESVLPGYECGSFSDLDLTLDIGPETSDLQLEAVVDYALFLKNEKWTFAPSLADNPQLACDYRNESIYRSPALAYAGKRLDGEPYWNVPSAWNLRDGEELVFLFGDVQKKGRIWVYDFGERRRTGNALFLSVMQPGPDHFPGFVECNPAEYLTMKGPIDLGEWSKQFVRDDWMALADPLHPDGMLPFGYPYLCWEVLNLPTIPGRDRSHLIRSSRVERRSGRQPVLQAYGALPKPALRRIGFRPLPKFPSPRLDATPPVRCRASRTVIFDFYNFLDVPMVRDRWRQYEAQEYVKVNRWVYPVSYQLSPYVGSDRARSEAALTNSSGLRLKITARKLPEITIDTIGGASSPAGAAVGFLPYNLMGGFEGNVAGGTALFHGHLQYGDRKRESRSGLLDRWGYYGWENYLDATLTLDRVAARKVLGITETQYGRIQHWWKKNQERVESTWKFWLYEEFKRLRPMPSFNYPLQVWTSQLKLAKVSPEKIQLWISFLTEGLDVLYGRWFIETFMPDFESSFSDMHIRMTIGPESADVDVDLVSEFFLSNEPGNKEWTWECMRGDNPFLAYEYRIIESPGHSYFGKRLPGEKRSAGAVYDYTPTAWNLKEGEQLNFHGGQSGLKITWMEPNPKSMPGQVQFEPRGAFSITGPADLRAWSKAHYPKQWLATDGLLPHGCPYLEFVLRT
jgi:hypothetical protein